MRDEVARGAAKRIAEASGVPTHDAVVVLGSGWAGARDSIGDVAWSVPSYELPGFRAPTAPGHTGTVASVPLRSDHGRLVHVLVLEGRTHLYEEAGVDAVVHGVRTAAECGARICILTNANGCLRPEWPTGTGVLIADHLDLAAVSPLSGDSFVDLTDCWSARLRRCARALDTALVEGTYAMVRGPEYQTLAELRMMYALGADVVGMSTVLEAITAHALGMEVLGLSVVTTNEIDEDGRRTETTDPDAVLKAAAEAATGLGSTIHSIIAAASDPVDPVDPVDPLDPVDSVNPADPSDPRDPSDPLEEF